MPGKDENEMSSRRVEVERSADGVSLGRATTPCFGKYVTICQAFCPGDELYPRVRPVDFKVARDLFYNILRWYQPWYCDGVQPLCHEESSYSQLVAADVPSSHS